MPAFYSYDKHYRPFTGYRRVFRFSSSNQDPVFDDEDAREEANEFESRYRRIWRRLDASKRGGLTSEAQGSSGEGREEGDAGRAANEDDPEKSVPTTFRGHSFTKWFNMFLQYARALALSGDSAEACSILDTVAEANVFRDDPEKVRIIRTLTFLLALRCEEYEQAYDMARSICGSRPGHLFPYRLYAAALAYSIPAMACFASGTAYKFFKRQATALDDMTTVMPQSGNPDEMASLKCQPNFRLPNEDSDDDGALIPLKYSKGVYPQVVFDDLAGQQPAAAADAGTDGGVPSHTAGHYQLTLAGASAIRLVAGHISMCSRSHMFSIMHYTSCLGLDPDNANACLATGIAYICRSMNRKADNRHLAVMQGISFIFRYAALKENALGNHGRKQGEFEFYLDQAHWTTSQEVAFNVARAFHHLGK
ncbi:transcription factor TFIIIC subunit tfc4 [Spiromyces aspiralis]|uniref:Transcription factor TFIIIC subunit tfc4 n=1 Tax=Spiromyces aspiralis TaxID=68401 RepID=A0ACC1HF99_9FUNG|nr:transcription factor TFIIIC subunit tfc4 [Spiromyces aspiralis]